MKPTAAIVLAVLMCCVAHTASAVFDEGIYLGQRDISCKRGVLIHGARTVSYPPGKSETITIPVPSDVVAYECGYRRARIICPIHTTRIKVRRALSQGKIQVKCYGDSLPVPGVSTAGTVEGGDEAEAEGEPAASP